MIRRLSRSGNSHRPAAGRPVGLRYHFAQLCAVLLCTSQPAEAASRGPSTLKSAEIMIDACIRYAGVQKFPPISIAVVDGGGHLIAFKRQDGASVATEEVAILKARTAAIASVTTKALGMDAERDAPTRDTLSVLGLTVIPGGAPFDGAQGAIGVSGAADEQDATCSGRAIAAGQAGQ